MSAGSFRRDIQGLRAVAVASVVIFHASRIALPGGYLGVDVFFVISGFLITGIILRSLDQGSFSFGDFYARRIRRLFPALGVMLAVVLVLGLCRLPPGDLVATGHAAAATVLFVSNLWMMFQPSYFTNETNPLLHTWSLGVEEQFYLFFPLLLVMLRRRRGLLMWTVILASVVSLLLAMWVAGVNPNFAFHLPFTRAFEVGIGVLAALGRVPALTHRGLRETAASGGLAAILASFVLVDPQALTPGPASLAACLGAAAVIHAGSSGPTLAGRLLSVSPAQFIGAISYSLYLWHWPLFVFARFWLLRTPTPIETIAIVIAAVTAAWASWYLIEQPALARRKKGFPVGLAITLPAATLAAAMAIQVTSGFASRFSPAQRQLFAASWAFSPERTRCHAYVKMPYATRCALGAPGAIPDLVVWGDSYGVELAFVLSERLARQRRALIQVTRSGCAPAQALRVPRIPDCGQGNAETLSAITADPRIRTVILAVQYRREPGSLLAGLEATMRGLRDAGKTVIILYPVPRAPFQVPSTLGLYHGPPETYRFTPDGADRDRAISLRLDAMRAAMGVGALIPAEAMCTRSLCRAYVQGYGPLYFDASHLSMGGARFLLDKSRIH